jgi:hypothetical protein
LGTVVNSLEMESRRNHPFFWFVVVYGSLIAALFVAVGLVVWRYTSIHFGWTYECQIQNCTVKTVDSQGSAAGKLQPGDRIIAVNGNRQYARAGIWSDTLLAIDPFRSYTIHVRRGTEVTEIELYASTARNTHRSISVLIQYIAGLVAFAAALWIGLLRPDQRTTQLFSFTWLSGSLLFLLAGMQPLQSAFAQMELRLVSFTWLLAFSPLLMATGFHFCYRFPPGVPQSHFWSTVKKVLYAWTGSLAAFFTIIRATLLWNPERGSQFVFQHYSLISGLEKLVTLANIIVLPAIAAVLARNYRTVQDPDQRRRIRWVVYGVAIGLIPFVIYSMMDYAYRAKLSFAPTKAFHDKFYLFANLAILLLPTTSAYAIIKHRMFEIQVIVRKGVQYLFAKKILQFFIYLPVVLIFLALRAQRSRPIPEVLFNHPSYILMLALAVAALLFRKNLLDALDRKFFRAAYNSEKILLNLGEEVKNFTSISEVAAWVSSQLKAALHPKEILVHYRQKERGGFVLAYSSNERPDVQRVQENSEWIRVAELEGKSVNSSSSNFQALPEEEKRWFSEFGIQLIVPMMGSDDRVKGLLLLGEKRSEEPYSVADRRLLEALAGQMAILQENLLLKEKVDEGYRLQRDVLAHLSSEKRNLLKECPACGTCYDSKDGVCTQDGAELILTLPVDRTIDEKYRLNSLIGKGGMGAVYRATDLRLGREIALKIMIGSMFGDSHSIRRFEREARASARLQHPNIITIHDFGGIGQGAYLAMELLDGYDLRTSLKENGNLSPAFAASWFDQILEGVKAAHQLGVIHRDLKPENIFISKGLKSRTHLKILDFGLAKVRAVDATTSGTLTAPGTAMGTLHYMSPEQILGQEVDERTDIFSLGVMIVEALTGKLPFDGNTTTDVAIAIMREDYHLPGDSPEIKHLDSILQRCLAKNRQYRYGSISEMQQDLIEAIKKIPPFQDSKRSEDSRPTDSILDV